MSRTLNDNRIKQLFNLIKTNLFTKAEAQEVSSIDVDTAPTEDSENLVTSGGVYEALSGAASDKLTEPSTFAIGNIFRVASIDADGHPVLEAIEEQSVPIKTIKIINTVLTPDENGVVTIPRVDMNNSGLLPIQNHNYTGIESANNGLQPVNGTEARISLRRHNGSINCMLISAANYDQAVKHAMCDEGIASGSSLMSPLNWTDTEKNGAWKRLNIIKSVLDSVLVPNAQYLLGEQSSLTLTLPSTADNGNIITVDFESGTTPTALSISGDVAGDITYAPFANTLVELSFKRSGNYWKLLTSSVDIPEEETA